MKKIKFIGLLMIVLTICFGTSGCASDNMENIDVLVTNYPNEYIAQMLYGEYSTITSIYPDGVDINSYEISSKQKKDFSKYDLFIYNGLIEKERDLAVSLLDLNSDLKIIDSSYVLETDYSPEELWLNPSSLLMMAQNVRLGLEEYVSSNVLKEKIDEQYNELKILLSELDVTYRTNVENTNNKKILVVNDTLKYLEKFGLEVYCIDENASDKVISDIENLVSAGEINYVYSFKEEELNDNAKKLLDNYSSSISKVEIHKLDNISDKERSEKNDYLSIMENNLELIKKEIY